MYYPIRIICTFTFISSTLLKDYINDIREFSPITWPVHILRDNPPPPPGSPTVEITILL